VYESDQYSKNAPRNHDARDPSASAPAFDDDGAGNLQQDVTYKKDSRASAKHTITETKIVGHFQSGVRNIHSIEKSNRIQQP
jgi:hypothetical protein